MFVFVPISFSKTLILQGFGGSFFLDKTKKTIFVKQQQNFKNLKKLKKMFFTFFICVPKYPKLGHK